MGIAIRERPGLRAVPPIRGEIRASNGAPIAHETSVFFSLLSKRVEKALGALGWPFGVGLKHFSKVLGSADLRFQKVYESLYLQAS